MIDFKKIVLVSTVTLGMGAMSAFAADTHGVLSPGDADFTKEGVVGPWTIYGDHDRGTCLIEGIDPDGFVVQMGLTADHGYGYLGVFSKDHFKVQSGAVQKITIKVNGNLYSGEMAEMKRNAADGYKGGYVVSDSPNFAMDIQKGYTLTAMPEDGQAVVISLDGTHDAIEAAKACNKKMAGG